MKTYILISIALVLFACDKQNEVTPLSKNGDLEIEIVSNNSSPRYYNINTRIGRSSPYIYTTDTSTSIDETMYWDSVRGDQPLTINLHSYDDSGAPSSNGAYTVRVFFNGQEIDYDAIQEGDLRCRLPYIK